MLGLNLSIMHYTSFFDFRLKHWHQPPLPAFPAVTSLPQGQAESSELKDTCNGSKTTGWHDTQRTGEVIISNQSTVFATSQPHRHLSPTRWVNDICSYWFVLQTTRRLIIEEYKQCTLFLWSENKARLRLPDKLGLISLIQQCLVPGTGNSTLSGF